MLGLEKLFKSYKGESRMKIIIIGGVAGGMSAETLRLLFLRRDHLFPLRTAVCLTMFLGKLLIGKIC